MKLSLDSLPAGLPVLLTGANGAIGSEIALALCRFGVPTILACRSELKYSSVLDFILKNMPEADLSKISYLELDLNRSITVTEAVNSLKGVTLAGIINNAGTMQRHFTMSEDGTETTMNVNFHNTRLLNQLLLPNVAEGGAIVFTTSLTRMLPHRDARTELVTESNFGQLRTYALSKHLITRFAAKFVDEAAGRDVRVNCADPGIVDSAMITMHRWYDPLANVIFRPFIRTPRNGAVPALRALLSPLSGHIFTLRKTLPLNAHIS